MVAAKKAEPKQESSAAPAGGDFRVTAPLVAVKNSKGSIVNLFAGDIVPAGTDQASIGHLIDLGYISKN